MTYRRWYVQADAHDLGSDRRRTLDDPRNYWCECDDPKPMPVDLWGSALGGYQECQRCGRPIIGSDETNPHGVTPSMLLALTTGQRLVCSIVLLVFVVVFVVWPVVRPPRAKHYDDARSWRRLMREIRRH